MASLRGSKTKSRDPKDYQPLPQGDEFILEAKEPFNTQRWRCIQDPGRARDTLGPCATLELGIICARNLLAWDASDRDFQAAENAYIRVLLDDRKVFDTEASNVSPPVWNTRESIDFLVPKSMVMIQVVERETIIGFVEICLGDIPWEQDIKGWFELRFVENLEGTSLERYQAHCRSRDADSRTAKHEVREQALQPENMGGFKECLKVCKRAPPHLDTVQHNAGELLLTMKMLRKDSESWLDPTLALVLDPAQPKTYPKQLESKPITLVQKVSGADSDGPKLNLQDLGDDITDIRIVLFDGAICCTAYFFSYILHWRSFPLSFAILVSLVSMWVHPWLGWIVFPALVAALLLLLASEKARTEMVVGGLNAPFSEEGFRQVARWRNTGHMHQFLRRVVEDDLKGKVIDEQEFSAVAACCFSNGVPKVPYQELREILKQAQFTEVKYGELQDGMLVIVDGQWRATVQRPPELHEDTASVTIKYEDGLEDCVESGQLMHRIEIPRIPLWVIPDSIQQRLLGFEAQVRKAKMSLQTPIRMATEFLTWKKPAMTCSVVVFLLLISSADLFWVIGTWNDAKDMVDSSGKNFQRFITNCLEVCKLAFRWASVGLGVFLFSFYARWFVEVRAVLKIIFRMLTVKRNAPECWSFFKADADS